MTATDTRITAAEVAYLRDQLARQTAELTNLRQMHVDVQRFLARLDRDLGSSVLPSGEVGQWASENLHGVLADCSGFGRAGRPLGGCRLMALWICVACTTPYSVGAPSCPHCGHVEHVEEGQPLPVPDVPEEPTAEIAPRLRSARDA